MQIPWSEPEDYLNIDWKSGNKFPTPHVEITQAEFGRFLHCGPYSLCGINYRQVRVDGWPWYVPARFYLFGRVALAVTTAHCPSTQKKLAGVVVPTEPLPGGKPGPYYLLRYWRLGCHHPNTRTTGVAMCLHRVVCPDCGWTTTYDSSG